MANEAPNATADETQPLLSPSQRRRSSAEDATVKDYGAAEAEAGVVEVGEGEGEDKSNAVSFAMVKFTIAVLGVFLANADTCLVLATYTSVASEFRNLADGPLILTAYQLGYSVALTVYGATSDAFGRKKPILAAYFLFGVGCLISGTANSLLQVIVGRAIAGAGGAGMTSMVSIIITDMVPLSQAVVLRGYVNIAQSVGRGLGAPIGGLLYDSIGWRWSFIGQIPIVLLCLIVACWQTLPPADEACKKRRLDGLGLVTFAIVLSAFLLLLDYGGRDSVSYLPVIYVLVGLFAVSAIAFVLVEEHWAAQPILPLSLMKQGRVWVCFLLMLLVLCAQMTLFSNMAAFFIRTENASTTVAALHIAVGPVGNAIGNILGSYIIGRTKRYKTVSIIAASMSFISYVLILVRWRGPINVWESLYVFPATFGIGILISSLFVGISAAVEKPQQATAISLYFLSQQLGVMIGASGSGALLQKTFRDALEGTLGVSAAKSEIIRGILNDTNYAFHLPKALQDIALSSYVHAFTFVMILALGYSGLTIPLSISISERKIE